MSKVNYYYDTKKLKFVEVKRTFRQRFLKILGFLSTAAVFAIVIIGISMMYIDSPKEVKLKRELNKLNLEYELLNEHMTEVEKVLGDLQQRDDNIYRVIFEADQVDANIRQGGFGGINLYRELQAYDNGEIMTETRRRLDRIQKKMYVQSKSYDKIVDLVKNKAEMLSSIPAIQPVANKDLARMASGYGYRLHPVYKTVKMHTGMDFTAQTGTEIYATGDGKVIKMELSRGGYGNLIVIDHGYGYQTYYAHLSRFNVRRGQKVKRGEVIGYVGNTGRSVGPHLHYEVRKNGNPINPVNFFYNDLSEEEYEIMLEMSSQSNQTLD